MSAKHCQRHNTGKRPKKEVTVETESDYPNRGRWSALPEASFFFLGENRRLRARGRATVFGGPVCLTVMESILAWLSRGLLLSLSSFVPKRYLRLQHKSQLVHGRQAIKRQHAYNL